MCHITQIEESVQSCQTFLLSITVANLLQYLNGKGADGTKKFRQWQELYIQLTWFNVFNRKIFLSVSLTYRIIQLEVLSPSSEMSLSRIKRGFLSSTSSVLCTPICIVHTYKCTDINTDNNTLWDICYQFEPLFENFQILESVTSKYLPNMLYQKYTQNKLKNLKVTKWRMKDEGWWFQALRVFCFLTDRWMDICNCRVTFATEKKTFNQNCECCCQFSVFELAIMLTSPILWAPQPIFAFWDH